MKLLWKTLGMSAIVWGMASQAGQAYTIQMGGTWVAPAGAAEFIQYGNYYPYDQRVTNSSSGPLAQGYSVAESYSSLEIGLGNDFSTSIAVPYSATRTLGGQANQQGFSDLSLSLSHHLWKREGTSGRIRLKVYLPTGDAEHSSGTTTVGLLHSSAFRLSPSLNSVFNLEGYYAMPQSKGGSDTWRGTSLNFNTGLVYQLSPKWYTCLEGLSSWSSAGTVNGVTAPDSGSGTIQIAPGVSYLITPDIALQASVMVPVLKLGFQDTYQYAATLATCWDF